MEDVAELSTDTISPDDYYIIRGIRRLILRGTINLTQSWYTE